MNRKPVIQNIPDFDGREIIISDLHGNLDAYQKLLKKADYKPEEDRLILLGDLVEKGEKNLDLLHLIMEQCENENVYAIMGNCDFVAKNVLYSYRLDYLQQVLLERKHSLIHEMIEKAGLEPVTKETDMEELCQQLRKHFLPELTFLNDLPHVLVSHKRIYAHAGINSEENFADDFKDVMTVKYFALQDKYFKKTVIVGHMPVSEYCKRTGDYNPRFERDKNIVSIDGGNMVNRAGQLNALILSKNYGKTIFEDTLPAARALVTTHPSNRTPFYLAWSKADVTILEKGVKQSRVHSAWHNRSFWVDNEFIEDGRCSNYTNYEMPLVEGEIVKTAGCWGDKVQVKKNGILGWTWKKNLEFIDPPLDA